MNYYYNPNRQMDTTPGLFPPDVYQPGYYQPPAAGFTWVNKNVDILMNNGTCFSNVRFLSVDLITPASPGVPADYLWTFEQYPSGGGAPIRRRVSPRDVAEINQAGTLCQPPPPPPTGGGTTGGMTGGGTTGGFCKQWSFDIFTGRFICIRY